MRLHKQGVRLAIIKSVLLVTTTVLILMAFYSAQHRRDALITLHQVSDAFDQFLHGTDGLTNNLRAYVITGRAEYRQRYFSEKNITRQREQALNSLFQQHLLQAEFDLIDSAEKKSTALLDFNQQILAMYDDGQQLQAMTAVYSAPYEQMHNMVDQTMMHVDQLSHQRLNDRVNQLDAYVNREFILAIIMILITGMFLIYNLLYFYHGRLLLPLVELTEKAKRLVKGEKNVVFDYSYDDEFGDLSKSLTNYLKLADDLANEQNKIQQERAWFDHIIESAPDAMLVVNRQGDILLANQKAHEVFGYTQNALLGMSVDVLTPENIRDRHAAMREKFMDDGGMRNFGAGKFRGVNKKGEEFPIELGLSIMPSTVDRESSVCIALRDISERKAVEKKIADQLSFMQILIDVLPYPVFYKNYQGCYLGFNKAFVDIFKVNRDFLLGKTVLDLPQISREDRIFYQEINEKITREGGVFMTEMSLHLADGEHPVLYALAGYGEPASTSAGTIGTLIDISVQKQSEKALVKAKALAEEATRLKSEFLANMSHEIRTPMNVIIGMSHLALEGELSEKQRNYITKVNLAARNLLALINDILDFSKIEAGKMGFEIKGFCLDEVIENLLNNTAFKAQEKALELLLDIAYDVPRGLLGDPFRLGQILINLVNNAIKFTEKGEVTISIHKIYQDNENVCLRFEVIDTGIGLSTSQQNKLFKPFSQADSSTSRKYGGTGLGLVICQRLVEMMDGEIGVDSELGRGSNFYFNLSFGVQTDQPTLLTEEHHFEEMRVLVIDDNISAREIMYEMLVSLKLKPVCVSQGSLAIEEITRADQENKPYHMVLVDWRMPVMDGVATIDYIKHNVKLIHKPIFVMLTAYNRDELLQAISTKNIDVHEVITKPVTPSVLLDVMLSALGKPKPSILRKKEKEAEYLQAINAVSGAYLLLAEDNAVTQEMVVDILQRAQIKVDVAKNGAEAVSKVFQEAYDGVLMDCQMPIMDGFEATRRIRSQEQFAQLPILAMTANAMSGDRELCLTAGMNDHIPKPIDVTDFFIILQKWIKPAHPQSVPVPEESYVEKRALPTIQGLRLESALQRLNGNSELLYQLLKRFADTQNSLIQRVQQALAAEDWEATIREMHSLKGLAGNIGAADIATRAAALETFFKQKQVKQYQEAMADLAVELAALIQRITSGLALSSTAIPTQHKWVVDTTLLAALTQDLEALALWLKQDDARATQATKALKERLVAAGESILAEELSRRVFRYDYEAALIVVNELLSRIAQK